jgi:opacity protein-like surface antigen
LGKQFYADLGARLKLPTASTSKRLGTGKVDFTIGVDLIKDIGNFSVYVGGRRRFNGQPDNQTLRNIWGVGAGASARISRSTSIGVDYDWQQVAYAPTGVTSELTAWSSFRVTRTFRMQVFVGTGFNSNSANFIGGIATSWRFH